ncbi:MAG: YerC/YecD family TrpR-related protein [Oligoflexus sp.]
MSLIANHDGEDGKALDDLFASLTKLRSSDEFKAFFDDLCTPAELRSMADRWRVARLLKQGISYRTINERTGVSTATITRVARSMTYGANGYQILLKRLEESSNE